MARASKAEAARHKQDVLDAASRMVREQGAEAVSVAEIMGAVGLTHGGFYRHFDSKEALVTVAVEAAFAAQMKLLDGLLAGHDGSSGAAREELVAYYLSAQHRDCAGEGCAAAGLATDVARGKPGSDLQRTYLAGLQNLIDRLDATSGSDAGPATREREALADLATLVGGLLLARAASGDELSDRMLNAVRHRLGR
jgi:TetR/AcrR family transcriptional repressor of nem operon